MPAPPALARARSFLAARAELVMFAVTLVWLAATAAGGSWLAPAARAVVASRLDHMAATPLYDVLAGGFAHLPLGEPAYRLGLLAAVLGAATLAGLVAASRALVKHPLPGVIAAVLVAIAPPVREAMGSAEPGMLAAAGLVWIVALMVGEPTRARSIRAVIATLAVIGAAPWLGAVVAIGVVAMLDRRDRAGAIAALGVAIFVLWVGAVGSLPALDPMLATVVATSGRGSAALVIGVGLVGVLFGAATGLPRARGVAVLVAVVATDALLVDHDALALIATLAIGVSIVLRAISRPLAPVSEVLVVCGGGLPLIGVAALLGAEIRLDDPGSSPTRLASDLIDDLPAGPGIVVATRTPGWFAIDHEQRVAGARPDLTLVPPARQSDVVVATALRDGSYLVGADVAAWDRLDPRRAVPAGRSFVLLGDEVARDPTIVTRAHYDSAIGRDQALRIDLARAAYEAATGRLDSAARALGLGERFGAADLAVLAATRPTRARPPLYAHVPEEADVRDELALFADDLAWVADLPALELPPNASPGRKLHAKWRLAIEQGAVPDRLWETWAE